MRRFAHIVTRKGRAVKLEVTYLRDDRVSGRIVKQDGSPDKRSPGLRTFNKTSITSACPMKISAVAGIGLYPLTSVEHHAHEDSREFFEQLKGLED